MKVVGDGGSGLDVSFWNCAVWEVPLKVGAVKFQFFFFCSLVTVLRVCNV